MPEDATEIHEGCTVVVQKGAYLKTCRLFPGRSYTFGKRGDGQFTLNLDGALGCTFGTSFRMERVSNRVFSVSKVEHQVGSLDIVKEGGVDNRDLQDDGRSQKLTPEEIIKLKNKGLSGKEVIQVITENSSTFKDKTVYSQEKYVSKKQKKYGEIITIHKPSVRLLCNMYYTQDPLKIANLRIDSLSQLLCHANIQAGGRFGVFESGVQGLVTASILHRMGSTGHLVQVYHGNHPQREAVDLMNFTTQELETLSFINVTKLHEVAQMNGLTNPTVDSMEITNAECNEEEANKRKNPAEDKQKDEGEGDKNKDSVESEEQLNNSKIAAATEATTASSTEGAAEENKTENKKQTTMRPRKFVRKQVEDVRVSSAVLKEGITGLVVACRQYPNNVTKELMQFLKPGHPFVVFSPYKEPLMELYSEVRGLGGTNLRLSETWLRHYQVLPQRTHPEINMSGGGGYLLYGTKVHKQL